jgi:hypothetical protein
MGKILDFFKKPSSVSFAVQEASPTNPQDKLGDPITNMTPEMIDRDYRTRINRGELAYPTWAMHEVLRLTPILSNYVRLWCDSLTGNDWVIKTVPDPDKPRGSARDSKTAFEAKADAQAKALRARYETIDVTQVVRHLALANVYGFSILSKHPGKLEPLNWWNFARVGLYGAWCYNPRILLQDGKSLPAQTRIDTSEFIVREVEENCLLEYLRIHLRINKIENYWDGNLEKESKRQVVIIAGQGLSEGEAAEFKTSATRIAQGASGCLASGSGDKTTSVLFPPESRGLAYYETRLNQLDVWACKALFGAPLIANTAPGSGTLAGNAHTETSEKRIAGAAGDISSVMQQQYDKSILIDAGLIKPGETPLAYFELTKRQAVDPEKEVQWTATLKSAGVSRDIPELEERTGMTLDKDPETAAPAAPAAPGKEPKPIANEDRGTDEAPAMDPVADRAAAELGVPTEWLQPIKAMLEAIEAKAKDQTVTDQELADYVKEAGAKIPELFADMDVSAFAEMLEAIIGTAAIEGARESLKAKK